MKLVIFPVFLFNIRFTNRLSREASVFVAVWFWCLGLCVLMAIRVKVHALATDQKCWILLPSVRPLEAFMPLAISLPTHDGLLQGLETVRDVKQFIRQRLSLSKKDSHVISMDGYRLIDDESATIVQINDILEISSNG
jgi:hypothetical protein